MDKKEIKKRIEQLKIEINIHRYNYHVLDKESISEAALDSLKNELFKLEQENPEFISADSPTQRVGGRAVDGFKKSKHFSQMFSLFDAFSNEDMIAWQERLLKLASGDLIKKWDYYCELKLDGLAVNLKYKNSLLVEGATRGNGKIGESILSNLKTINSIPLKVNVLKKEDLQGINDKLIFSILDSDFIEVRGEAIISKSGFEKINKIYKKDGRALLANTRNAAAGSLRQLNPQLSAERKLQFYAYDIIFYKDGVKQNILISREKADFLTKKLGFKTSPYNKLCLSLNEVFDFHKYWEKNKDKLDFNIDGVVVKVNEFKLWDFFGTVGKAPRYSMAYKFSAEQSTTKIKDVVWQVGRTGVLTPIAVLDPVKLSGAIISRSTLHNMDEINRLEIKIGDTVIVERAGDVIPKIISVLKNLRNGNEQKICTPKKCPICESKVSRIDNEVAFRCLNPRCYAVNLRQIIHFVSKGAMDIESVGPKVVEQLLSMGLISDYADLYLIEKDDLLALDGFAEKSAKKLVDSMESKKNIKLSKFLYSLGIKQIGETASESLSIFLSNNIKGNKVLKTINIGQFLELAKSMDQTLLEEINDFGPIVSNSMITFFKDEHNIRILEKLEKIGITLFLDEIEDSLKDKNSVIFSKNFLLTGTLSNLTRELAKAKIKDMGGRVLSAISNNVDFLIYGENPGSKLKKAKELGVEVVDEKEFLKMINFYGNK